MSSFIIHHQKEIADYIEEHEDAYQLLNTAVTNKADKSEVDTLKATVDALGALAKKDTVSETELDSALKAKIHTHDNQTVLDGITNDKVQSWDNKAEKTTATTGADGLMSSADKTRLEALRGVRYGTTAPGDMQDGELFVRVVSA